MVTLAVTLIAGAVLNAAAFTGGNVVSKYLSGKDKDTDEEKNRHDLAMEKNESDYNKYQKKEQEFESWEYQQEKNKNKADENFENTDENLKYNEMHEKIGKKPDFKDYYQLNNDQKNSVVFIGIASLGISYFISKML